MSYSFAGNSHHSFAMRDTLPIRATLCPITRDEPSDLDRKPRVITDVGDRLFAFA